jgi:hypothetical protein
VSGIFPVARKVTVPVSPRSDPREIFTYLRSIRSYPSVSFWVEKLNYGGKSTGSRRPPGTDMLCITALFLTISHCSGIGIFLGGKQSVLQIQHS